MTEDINDRTSQGAGRASNEGQSFPRDEEVRKNYPGATGGRKSDAEQSGISEAPEDQDFGRKDPQEVMDNNINQYTTGRPN